MRLSLAEARRIALAAQGFAEPRPDHPVTAADMARLIRQLGVVQIDYVNVLVPAHYQVPFSRLGPYSRSLFDEVVYSSSEFTEQWAHEASIIPVRLWPLLRHRMRTRRLRPWGFDKLLAEHPDYGQLVLEHVRDRGPLSADDLPPNENGPIRIAGAWHSSVARAVLEAHFTRGLLAVRSRRPDFARVFDLSERIIPPERFASELSQEEAERELVRIAAAAHGIATAADLADYFRTPLSVARPAIAELLAAGELRAVQVEGWREAALLWKDAVVPTRIERSSLLSPFDPLVWFRPRVARLFQFDYRLEIFVPEPQRKWGYYVLPFLRNEGLVARVDLKADRPGRRLLVIAAYLEDKQDPAEVSAALAAELGEMAKWLGLSSVSVGRRGNLSRSLGAAVRAL